MKKKSNNGIRRKAAAAAAVGLAVILTAGSVFSASAKSPYGELFSEQGAAILEGCAVPVGLSQRVGDVTMTVDSYINTGNGVVAAVTFDNHSPNPWEFDVEMKDDEVTVYSEDNTLASMESNEGHMSRVMTVSPDGKKFTCLVEASGTGDVKGKTVRIQVDGLVREPKMSLKEADLNLGSLVNQGSVISRERVLGDMTNDPYMEQYQLLKGNAGVVLDVQFPGVTVAGAEIMGDGISASEGNGGLAVYIRNDMKMVPAHLSSLQVWPEKLTDKATGAVYDLGESRQFADEEGNHIMAVRFPEILTAEAASKLTISEVGIRTVEKEAEGRFEIGFKADGEFKGGRTLVSAALMGGQAYDGEIILSPLRFTLKGTLAEPQAVSQVFGSFGRQMVLNTSEGGVKVLSISSMSLDDTTGRFCVVYEPWGADHKRAVLDTEDIVSVQLGNTTVDLKK